MLCINSASALTPTTWIRAALLSLSTIASEARNRLLLLLLIHELLVSLRQFFDLGLELSDICGLFAHHWRQAHQHGLSLYKLLVKLTFFRSHHLKLCVGVGCTSMLAIVLH